MAVFDPELRRIILRVVYDGPGFAGKTTNIRRLHGFFTSLRRSEVFVPGEMEGRTQFFDLMSLDGGLVQGHALRCQLLTVPGQWELRLRRQAILERADVVVFVVESTPAGVEEAKPVFESLNELLSRPEIGARPVVLQANKQDLDGALSAEAVAALLGMDGGTSVSARACDGMGVRETAVLAIRAAANRVQRVLLEQGVDALRGRAETGEALLERLAQIAPVRATGNSISDAAEAAVAAAAQAAEEAALATIDEEDPASGGLPAPSPEQRSEPDAGPRAVPLLVAELTVQTTADVSTAVRGHETSDRSVPSGVFRHEPAESSPEPAEPIFPSPQSPSGYIWPAATGREILKEVVQAGEPLLRRDLVAQHGLATGSGSQDLRLYRAGDWCLKTSPRRHHRDSDAARAALLRLIRSKILLGDLLPERSVVALGGDAGTGYWVWTVSPWLTTLRSAMTSAAVQGADQWLGEILTIYARCAVDALVMASRRRIVLDVHPSNFALGRDGCVYLDDDVATGDRIPSIGHALLRRVHEYAGHGAAVEAYVQALERSLVDRITAEEAAGLDLSGAFAGLAVRAPRVQQARDRLVDVVSRRLRRRAV